jgi:hypothetical protein
MAHVIAAAILLRHARGPVYVIKLQANPDGSGIRSLRQLLKVLGRYHGLRIDAHEERAS